jgi:CheY-like chemotaxis protein
VSTICLIAESDPFIASLLLRFAQESGLQAARAATGEETLTLAQQLLPAVVVVDPELPGERRGWEAIRAMRGTPATAGIPVISCSWLNRADSGQLLGDLAWHLQKPGLYYDDFVRSLAAAGVAVEEGN